MIFLSWRQTKASWFVTIMYAEGLSGLCSTKPRLFISNGLDVNGHVTFTDVSARMGFTLPSMDVEYCVSTMTMMAILILRLTTIQPACCSMQTNWEVGQLGIS